MTSYERAYFWGAREREAMRDKYLDAKVRSLQSPGPNDDDKLAALLAAGNRLHDLAWHDGRSFRLIASANELLAIDRAARRWLRRDRRHVKVLTLQASGRRYVTREYARRWLWWPFAVRVIPYSESAREYAARR